MSTRTPYKCCIKLSDRRRLASAKDVQGVL
jgi:hypothetical protein